MPTALLSIEHQPTFRDLASEQLGSLCAALELPSGAVEAAADLFEQLAAPWSAWQIGDAPLWANDICDDGSPYEFSVAFGNGAPELRLLAEPQSTPLGPGADWRTGTANCERLRRAGAADTTLFESVQDLFVPRGPEATGRFSLWHAAVLGVRGPNLHKVYLNPQIAGPSAAPLIVKEAMRRLGRSQGWEFLREVVQEHPAETRYFSLDHSSPDVARAKLYVARGDAGAVVKLVEGSTNMSPAEATAWLEQLGASDRAYTERPVLVCYGFKPNEAVPETTLHVPIRSFVNDDAEALSRITPLLSPADADRLSDAISGLARRPLHAGRGMITYASLRPSRAGLRVTVYLAPELYAIRAPRRVSAAPLARKESERRIKVPSATVTMTDVQAKIAARRSVISQHRFLTQLESDVPLDSLRRMVPRLAFFVLAFQDVLRLARQYSREAGVRDLARTHELEDKGHDAWYLNDLERLGVQCDVRWLFSPEHELTRDVAYQLISEVIRADDDRSRLAVALSLEAIGAEFFYRIIGLLERSSELVGVEQFEYFARPHQQIESSHDVFEEATQALLAQMVVPHAFVKEVMSAVDRTFDAMTVLASDLQAALELATAAHRSP